MAQKFEREVTKLYGQFVEYNGDSYVPSDPKKYSKLTPINLMNKLEACKKEIDTGNIRLYGYTLIFDLLISIIVYIGVGADSIPLVIIIFICSIILAGFLSKNYLEDQNIQDVLWEMYQRIKYEYAHSLNCPMCNISLEIKEYSNLPFQGKCPQCNYIFIVKYDQKKEKYITYGERGGKHIHRIYYEGIKAIKPTKQKITYVDESVNISIQDTIMYRSIIVGKNTK